MSLVKDCAFRADERVGAAVGLAHVEHLREQEHLRPGLPDFYRCKIQKRGKYTKRPQSIPIGHKIYQMAVNYSKWTCSNLLHFLALENYPNWEFWYENIPSGNHVRVSIFVFRGFDLKLN
jgi:hypothetical protein